ncbi:hypothetical protein [Wenzhouxiangella sp. EGI_FJ10409]|uniref:hypothetical protein n=1 Tax=Wenzhouxiangella sp. EGI_FJ10409 TaxID=3243767 RepID=UPI0035D542F8
MITDYDSSVVYLSQSRKVAKKNETLSFKFFKASMSFLGTFDFARNMIAEFLASLAPSRLCESFRANQRAHGGRS